MESCLALFENVRQEKPLKILLSLTSEGILKQPGFTDYERYSLKSFALKNFMEKNIEVLLCFIFIGQAFFVRKN